MPKAISVCVASVCLALVLTLPPVAAAEIGNASPVQGELDAADREALFDLACGKLVSTFATKSEKAHRAEMPRWMRICSAHPTLSKCVDAAEVIKGRNEASPLHCGPGIRASSDIAGSFLPAFDQVCAKVTATWLSGTEDQRPVEVSGWVKTCNAHPDISVCRDADDLINDNRNVRPLNCGSGGS